MVSQPLWTSVSLSVSWGHRLCLVEQYGAVWRRLGAWLITPMTPPTLAPGPRTLTKLTIYSVSHLKIVNTNMTEIRTLCFNVYKMENWENFCFKTEAREDHMPSIISVAKWEEKNLEV